MAKQTISLGTEPKGETGDTSRVAFLKCIANFDELYRLAQGKLAKPIAGGAGVVALTDDEATNGILDFTGQITGNRVVTVNAALTQCWLVRNSTSGAFDVSFKTTGGSGVSIPQGSTLVLYCDGVNILDPVTPVVTAAVAAGMAAANAPEVGHVKYFAQNTAPTGYLKANGGAVSRVTYSALFAKIGTTYGAGDGSSTFNLPDLRGEFVRGWDDGRGADPSRPFGSNQGGSFTQHIHVLDGRIMIGSIVSSGMNAGVTPGAAYTNVGELSDSSNGPGPYTSSSTSAAAGNETRPRNVALLACIKF